MLKKIKFTVLALCAIPFTGFSQKSDLKLWYTAPASAWTDALPLGNGRIGAMVYGGTGQEHIQFNEETLWTGGPRNYNRPGSYAYLPQIRTLLAQGKQAEAEKLATEQFMGTKSPSGDRQTWFKAMRSLKGLTGNPALPSYNDSNWKAMKVPAYEGWETVGFDGLDGAVWFRTSFMLPESWNGKDLMLDLNRIRDQDFTYVNGKQVGTTESTEPRKYIIPANVLVKGKNVIAVQVLNYIDKGGIAGYKDTTRHISVYPQGLKDAAPISLNTNWKYLIQDSDPPEVGRFQADYQPFGDLYLNFKKAPVQQYKRELDLKNAISKVSYTSNGITYIREYFISEPHQLLVMHLTASKPGSITLEAILNSPHAKSSTRKLDNNTLALSLAVRDGKMRGESYLRAQTVKGTVQINGNKLVIANANEVTLYLAAGTNFKNYHDVSGDPAIACKTALAGIRNTGYQAIRDAHIKEYQGYFNSFSINLGRGANEGLPTNERIEKFATSNDPAFAALYLQYGRYLLISSSRPGTQPANLQGIWNNLLAPPWGSKYTTNINAQMNYWPAEMLNLSACHEPLLKMVAELAETGKETARDYYGLPGWVEHHNTDIWRGAAAINASNHGIWVTGGAWLSQHLWEHYLFTQDRDFLARTGYPVMREAAKFFAGFLVKDPKTGWLISTPSNSPEHGGLVAGPAMDHQIIRNLFDNCIAAAKILGADEPFRKELESKYKQIAPNQIGKHGQLQEWLEDKDDPEDKHRHVSHLWAVYPGNEVNWDETPAMMKAARQSLLYRGDLATGWSLAWKINLWSRFKDGDHAWKLLTTLIRPVGNPDGGGGSYVNLFDAHPPFQIDGNFGGAAGIAEMLLQSQAGYLDLLPALPPAFSDGDVKGICARGGFTLNFKWQNSKLTEVEILSKSDTSCTLRYGSKSARIELVKGVLYKVNGDLKSL